MKRIVLIGISLAVSSVLAVASQSNVNNQDLNITNTKIGKNSTILSILPKNRIIIEQKTKEGQRILDNIKQYKKYLKYKEVKVAQVEKNSCKINILEIAVSKLIKKVNILKENNTKMQHSLNKNLTLLKNENKRLKISLDKNLTSLKNENKKLKVSLDKNLTLLKERSSDLKTSFLRDQETTTSFNSMAPKNSKLICSKKKILVKDNISRKEIYASYVRFINPQRYQATKNLFIYNLPVLGISPLKKVEIKKGTSFIADMWTYAGWIHAKGKGWVKGYKLNPKFLQKKVSKKYIIIKPKYKIIESCTKKLKKD